MLCLDSQLETIIRQEYCRLMQECATKDGRVWKSKVSPWI